MSNGEVDSAAAEVAEFHEVFVYHDNHGWESVEQERDILTILIDAKKKLAFLQGSGKPDPELPEFQDRLVEVEAEIAEQTGDGERWAETVEIVIRPIGLDIIDQAATHFGSPQGHNGVLAYCRHYATNYDSLLTKADQFPGRPQDILKMRANALVAEALKHVGIDESSFYEIGEDVT